MSRASLPRRRTLLLGFLAAFIPLLVLLGLQYVWLSRLAKTTAIAHEAALHYFLETVGDEVEHAYHAIADRCLNVPYSALVYGDLGDEVAEYWASRPVDGVRRLFLVDYTRELYGNYYVFDWKTEELRVPLASDESLAMIAACNPWQAVSYWGGRADSHQPFVDERDPAYRIVLKPVTDEASAVIGVAGLIVDEDHFRDELLPGVIENLLDHFFSEDPRQYFAVHVRDGSGRTVYSSDAAETLAAAAGTSGTAGPEAAAMPVAPASMSPGPGHAEYASGFPFVFADWTIALESRGRSPKDVARASFLTNVTISAVLSLALLGGVLLVLRGANRAFALSEMKADFVSNVSHELRTPVSSIRVFGEFLKSGRADAPETVRRYGRHIEAESRRLSRLIDNVLDFSKIESGHKEYEFTEADLGEVVETVVETFQVRLRDRGFDIRYEPPAEPVRFPMDPDALGQVLHNLLDNAIKYSGDSREVTVRLAREGATAALSVRDLGIGIPRADQKKVFDRFHRVGNSLVHDVKGSGLGLSIVQHVVRAHGGTVDLDSDAGRGTTVHVRLPLDGTAAGRRPAGKRTP